MASWDRSVAQKSAAFAPPPTRISDARELMKPLREGALAAGFHLSTEQGTACAKQLKSPGC
jgi:hypothetical protein